MRSGDNVTTSDTQTSAAPLSNLDRLRRALETALREQSTAINAHQLLKKIEIVVHYRNSGQVDDTVVSVTTRSSTQPPRSLERRSAND